MQKQPRPSTSSSSTPSSSPASGQKHYGQHYQQQKQESGSTLPSSSPQKDFLRRGTLTKRLMEKEIEARLHLQDEAELAELAQLPQHRRRPSSSSSLSLASSTGSSLSARSASHHRKPSVPKAHEIAKLLPKANKNHIVENRRAAIGAASLSSSSSVCSWQSRGAGGGTTDGRPHRHKAYGKIPSYLLVCTCTCLPFVRRKRYI